MTSTEAPIERISTEVYRFPTPTPEADGTLEWDATTAVVVTISSGQHTGLGWTYSAKAAETVINDHLAAAIRGLNLFDIDATWAAMHRACRNLGTKGLVLQALSAVDVALWDLKARALDVPLSHLLGAVHPSVPIYGSGGFTNLDRDELAAQVEEWRSAGCTAMKIKIGQGWGEHVPRDLERVRELRDLAGDNVQLMVDANGGYGTAKARRVGADLDELGVVWFEEPVSSDDTEGLAVVRNAVRCDVAAGEYASDSYDAARLCPVVDCLQLDATRCGGYTGWRRGAAIAAANNLQVSAHCAPALHAPVAASVTNLRHIEYFIDHVRLESLLLEGVPAARDGSLHPAASRGHGMTLNAEARQFLVS